MQNQVWVSILSLVGVLLGGGLSYLVQASVQRRNDRVEARKQAHERQETRRTEQLELLREFIKIAQRAERTAEDRDDTQQWKVTALDVIDELWVCERMIHILFASELHALARTYVKALDHVVWNDKQPAPYLRESKTAFLDAARGELTHSEVTAR